MSQVAACTIAAKPELAFARVIATSWKEHHPEIPCFVLLADELDGVFDPEAEPFTLITLDELAQRDVVAGMCDRYGREALTRALTPHAIAHLLDQGFEKVLFFRQGSLINKDHSAVIDHLGEHPIVLTPQITEPLEGAAAVNSELGTLMAGVYDGAFVGVSGSEQARAMLDWWRLRLAERCQFDLSLGLNYEQGWLELAPMFFEDTLVLREGAGANKPRRRDFRRRLAAADHRSVSKWPWAFAEPAPIPPDARARPAVGTGAPGAQSSRDREHAVWREAPIGPVDGGLAICTIFGKNHLALARVLAAALAEHHPGVPFFAVLADHPEGYFDPQDEDFPITGLKSVGYGDQWLNADEGHKGLAPQLKPYALSRLLEAGYDSALFLDADMLLTAPIDDVLDHVRAHAVTLSPHILAPLDGPLHFERELVIIRAGAYNGGMLGVSAGAQTKALLDWWKNRMHGRCLMDRFAGLHHDQRWLQYIPSFVDDVHTLRDPGVNVGHWNLPERAAVEPRLLHFSGYRLGLGDQITYYDTRLAKGDIGGLAVWWERYDALLRAAGFEESRNWPYAFGPRPFHPAAVGEPVPAI